jgi:hypothetical protein
VKARRNAFRGGEARFAGSVIKRTHDCVPSAPCPYCGKPWRKDFGACPDCASLPPFHDEVES